MDKNIETAKEKNTTPNKELLKNQQAKAIAQIVKLLNENNLTLRVEPQIMIVPKEV